MFGDFYDINNGYTILEEKPNLKQYTDITILLDRSGSMASIREAMEHAYFTFINEHKAVPSTKITLVQFDDVNPYDVVYQCVPVGAVEKLVLKPRGNTPLNDAFATTIDRTGERLGGMNESDRPDQVLMVVITDGQENASKSYKRADVALRVNKQRDAYKWQFVYLGANQDAFTEAASYGIPQNWALNYTANARGVTGSASAMSVNTVSYTSNSAGMRGTSLRAFTETQRKQAIDDDTTTTKSTV